MPLTPTRKIWMEGELVDWDDARIHVLNPSLHYGWGVFEGIRAYATDRGPAVFRLTEHIERLFRSAHIYMMEPRWSVADIVAATKETVRVNEIESCYIRPLLYLDYGEMGLNPLPSRTVASIACWPWGAYLGDEAANKGVRAVVSSWQRIGHNTIPPAGKATGQYINSSLAKVAALKAGYDEAIMLTPGGNIAEGSGENIFCVYGRRLITPPLVDGVLAGLTRDAVMTIARDEGYEVVEATLTRADLYLADEAFFTGTAAEMVPLVEVDDRAVGSGKPGPVTRHLLELFQQATVGKLDRYKLWNEFVSE
ncbi:MAG TPA: branched-chain-amino-acid transaminase [Mycobacteriales bacterium]|jgi:branched-chain amino acid aminotransferase|nr:branched-chain-amino-acid transaminase [Mycobacteriales bacterium]